MRNLFAIAKLKVMTPHDFSHSDKDIEEASEKLSEIFDLLEGRLRGLVEERMGKEWSVSIDEI